MLPSRLPPGRWTRPNRRATPTSSRMPSKSPLRPRSRVEARRSLTSFSCATLAYAREHDLPNIPDMLAGLAIVATVRGDLSTAVAAHDELRGRQRVGGSDEMRAYRRLACAFVDQAQGDTVFSASEATDVVAGAERLHYRYVKVIGTELLAAAVARDDPARALELLAAASDERTAMGATPWPLEPYRDAALRRRCQRDHVGTATVRVMTIRRVAVNRWATVEITERGQFREWHTHRRFSFLEWSSSAWCVTNARPTPAIRRLRR